MSQQEDRLIRLEELVYFQEEKIKELNDALTGQQAQVDRLERQSADMAALVRILREKLTEQPENSLPPHSMPERF